MSTRTFCDRCGEQCQGKIFRVNVCAQEMTNKGEPVSNDMYQPVDLCGPCGKAYVLTLVPDMRVRGRHDQDSQPFYPDEMRGCAPVPPDVEGL
jgi:hypothetical protein